MVLRLSEIFKEANTLYALDSIDIQRLPLDVFQQWSAVLVEVKLNQKGLVDKKIQTLEKACRMKNAANGKKIIEASAL